MKMRFTSERKKPIPVSRDANSVVLWGHIKWARCQGREAVGGRRGTPKIGVDVDKARLPFLEELESAHLSCRLGFRGAVRLVPS